MIIREEVLNMINSGTYISTTRAGADALVLASTLTPGASYLITDPIDGGQILLKAGSVNTFEPNGTWYKTNEFRAFGFFRLSGVAGSVDTVNVNAVNQLTGVIPFNTTARQTLDDVATNINANGARVVNAVVCQGDLTLDQPYMVLERLVGGVNTDAVTVTTTTLVADDIQNMTGGAVSSSVRYDVEYVFSTTNPLSRIVRCYDPTENCDIGSTLAGVQTYSSISGVDNTGTIKPGFFRWGTPLSRNSRIGVFFRQSTWRTGTLSGFLNLESVFTQNSLVRGIASFSGINGGNQLTITNVTTGSSAVIANITIGGIGLNLTNQSIGNLNMSSIMTHGGLSLTTRITHSTGTSTILGLFAEGTPTLTLILARAVGLTPSVRLGAGSTLSLNFISTAGSAVLQRINLEAVSSLIITNNNTANAAFGLSGITVKNGSVVACTTNGSVASSIINSTFKGVSMTLTAPSVNIVDSEFISNSTFSAKFLYTSLNDIIYQGVNVFNNLFKMIYTKTGLTGAVNNGLSGSPIYLGNLPEDFWATNTVREATGLTGVGALLQLGIETDDDDAMIPATAIGTLTDRLVFNAPVNTKSTALDRRLIATPTVANITAGQFTGYVEGFIGF